MRIEKVIEAIGVSYLILVGLTLSYFGYLWIFTPTVQMEKLSLIAPTIPAMSLLRSLVGSGLITFAAMTFLFIRNREAWFKPLLIFASVLLFARCFSLIVDGTHERMALYAVLEGLIVLDLLLLKRLNQIFRREHS